MTSTAGDGSDLVDWDTARRRIVQFLACPLREVRIPDEHGKTVTISVHENVLKSALIMRDERFSGTQLDSPLDLTWAPTIKVVAMALEYGYKGEYSPSVADIQGMHPEAQQVVADVQLELCQFVTEGFGMDFNHPLLDMAIKRLDACRISAGTFISMWRDVLSFEKPPSRLWMWCVKWAKKHRDEILVSREFEEVIDDGGDCAMGLVRLFKSEDPAAGSEVSRKRKAEDLDTD